MRSLGWAWALAALSRASVLFVSSISSPSLASPSELPLRHRERGPAAFFVPRCFNSQSQSYYDFLCKVTIMTFENMRVVVPHMALVLLLTVPRCCCCRPCYLHAVQHPGPRSPLCSPPPNRPRSSCVRTPERARRERCSPICSGRVGRGALSHLGSKGTLCWKRSLRPSARSWDVARVARHDRRRPGLQASQGMPKEGTMPSLPKPASPLWGDWTDIEVKAATVIWVNRMVIGLDLCPFALASMPGLRVVVSKATKKEEALDELALEMDYLVQKPKNKPATTLVVFPLMLFSSEQSARDQDPGIYIYVYMYVYMCVSVCCVCVCVCGACVRACVRACVHTQAVVLRTHAS